MSAIRTVLGMLAAARPSAPLRSDYNEPTIVVGRLGDPIQQVKSDTVSGSYNEPTIVRR